MGEDWNSWSEIIRSQVLSAESALTPSEINQKVKLIKGRNIPFRAFSFQTLDEMLVKISGLKTFKIHEKVYILGVVVPFEETTKLLSSVEKTTIQSQIDSFQQSLKILQEKLESVYKMLNSSENDKHNFVVNTNKNDFEINQNHQEKINDTFITQNNSILNQQNKQEADFQQPQISRKKKRTSKKKKRNNKKINLSPIKSISQNTQNNEYSNFLDKVKRPNPERLRKPNFYI